MDERTREPMQIRVINPNTTASMTAKIGAAAAAVAAGGTRIVAVQPSFGAGSNEVQGLVFESGKPLVVTQSVDGESGREYSVTVTATILK